MATWLSVLFGSIIELLRTSETTCVKRANVGGALAFISEVL
jgi:hypothetical protein